MIYIQIFMFYHEFFHCFIKWNLSPPPTLLNQFLALQNQKNDDQDSNPRPLCFQDFAQSSRPPQLDAYWALQKGQPCQVMLKTGQAGGDEILTNEEPEAVS